MSGTLTCCEPQARLFDDSWMGSPKGKGVREHAESNSKCLSTARNFINQYMKAHRKRRVIEEEACITSLCKVKMGGKR